MNYKEICKLYDEYEERYSSIYYFHKKDHDLSLIDHDSDFTNYVLWVDEYNCCVKLPDFAYETEIKLAKKLMKIKLCQSKK